jgi:ribosomal protein S18 acetylase RimI-like enzyme
MTAERAPRDIRIVRADTPVLIEEARELFLEYARSLDFDLCFQNFDDELKSLPGAYAPPSGCLFIALIGGRVGGCVAVRQLEPGICEMKRLYVRETHRGMKIGRMLAEAIVEEARRLGYARMRLDAIDTMTAAVSLYDALGFKKIPPYRHNPVDGVVFLELVL